MVHRDHAHKASCLLLLRIHHFCTYTVSLQAPAAAATAMYGEYVPQSPTYSPSSPACRPPSPSPWCNTAPAYMVVQQENVEFIDAEEHERLVNNARYKGPDFTKRLKLQHKKRQRAVASRKRIYGEEYCTLTDFNVVPQFKMMKLDRPQYELVATNATINSTTTTSSSAPDSDVVTYDVEVNDGSTEEVKNRSAKRYANPTPTVRQSSVFKLTAVQIPRICMECLSTRCYCESY